MGDGSDVYREMTRELGKLKKFITIFAISVLLLPLLFSLLAAASVVAAPIIALDAAKTWIVGWFEDENIATDLLSKWHAEVYPNFEDYGSYEEVGYAEAISCYYFLETEMNSSSRSIQRLKKLPDLFFRKRKSPGLRP